MNALSLAYSNAQNQQHDKSWKDDPFDLKGKFAGAANINHEKDLNYFLLDMVGNYAKHHADHCELTLDMLAECDQNELARLYIESIDREIEYACYGSDQTLNSDFLCAMLAMLKDDNEDTREQFAVVTRRNILISYADELNILLSNACDDYVSMHMNEQNYYQYEDENSAVAWRKF